MAEQPRGHRHHRPYLVNLPGGRTIVVFFYNGEISATVAFENLLSNGERFAERLLGAFAGSHGLAWSISPPTARPTGTTTGTGTWPWPSPAPHRSQRLARLTITPNTWSTTRRCMRRSAKYSAWAAPRRRALVRQLRLQHRHEPEAGPRPGGRPCAGLNWLRDELAPLYEKQARSYLKEPWKARNDYISVILDRSRRVRRISGKTRPGQTGSGGAG